MLESCRAEESQSAPHHGPALWCPSVTHTWPGTHTDELCHIRNTCTRKSHVPCEKCPALILISKACKCEIAAANGANSRSNNGKLNGAAQRCLHNELSVVNLQAVLTAYMHTLQHQNRAAGKISITRQSLMRVFLFTLLIEHVPSRLREHILVSFFFLNGHGDKTQPCFIWKN